MNLTEALQIKNYEKMRVVSLTEEEAVLELAEGTRIVITPGDKYPYDSYGTNPILEYELED